MPHTSRVTTSGDVVACLLDRSHDVIIDESTKNKITAQCKRDQGKGDQEFHQNRARSRRSSAAYQEL